MSQQDTRALGLIIFGVSLMATFFFVITSTPYMDYIFTFATTDMSYPIGYLWDKTYPL